MKKWLITISQNGWEYTGYAYITANKVIRDLETNNAVYADGIRIEFDEEIKDPKELN